MDERERLMQLLGEQLVRAKSAVSEARRLAGELDAAGGVSVEEELSDAAEKLKEARRVLRDG